VCIYHRRRALHAYAAWNARDESASSYEPGGRMNLQFNVSLFECDRVSRRGRNRTSSSLLIASMPLLVLDLRQTAVHYNLAASREARFVGGEKQRSRRDLFRAPNPTQRGL
jgi:hypothetical protein